MRLSPLNKEDSIKITTVQNYIEDRFYSNKIQDFMKAETHPDHYEQIKDRCPIVEERDTCGVVTAGRTIGNTIANPVIQFSSWILVYEQEAKKTARHELAHVVQVLCDLEGGFHGRGFNKALKITAPRTFRADRIANIVCSRNSSSKRRTSRCKGKSSMKAANNISK